MLTRELFAAALVEVERELDWALLGRLYCEGGGDEHFDEEQRAAIREAGLRFAAEVAGELASLGAGEGGSSLYLGASVAELAPILCESLVLGRRVEWRSVAGPERDALDRALGRAGERIGRALPRVAAGAPPAELRGRCEHVWMTSVLTDPDAFPALHDALYGRSGADATGRGDLEEESSRAERLVSALLDCARAEGEGALVSTTDEELRLVAPAARDRGWRLSVPDRGRLSGVVGDVVRHCRVRAGRSGISRGARGDPRAGR